MFTRSAYLRLNLRVLLCCERFCSSLLDAVTDWRCCLGRINIPIEDNPEWSRKAHTCQPSHISWPCPCTRSCLLSSEPLFWLFFFQLFISCEGTKKDKQKTQELLFFFFFWGGHLWRDLRQICAHPTCQGIKDSRRPWQLILLRVPDFDLNGLWNLVAGSVCHMLKLQKFRAAKVRFLQQLAGVEHYLEICVQNKMCIALESLTDLFALGPMA